MGFELNSEHTIFLGSKANLADND